MRIDLHGYHVHEAWRKFNQKVENAYYKGVKRCTVITGQGQMMKEFPTWVSNHPRLKEYRQTKYNPGSFTIFFVKKG
tara:strand:- start:333 stop:563 length:231 start_codon:yes stop_codon:yes gene_type:complete